VLMEAVKVLFDAYGDHDSARKGCDNERPWRVFTRRLEIVAEAAGGECLQMP
jgi:hypothetical protein